MRSPTPAWLVTWRDAFGRQHSEVKFAETRGLALLGVLGTDVTAVRCDGWSGIPIDSESQETQDP